MTFHWRKSRWYFIPWDLEQLNKKRRKSVSTWKLKSTESPYFLVPLLWEDPDIVDCIGKWEWSWYIEFFPPYYLGSVSSSFYTLPLYHEKRKPNICTVQKQQSSFIFMSVNSWKCPDTTCVVFSLFSQNSNYIFCMYNNWLSQ